jgi:hypothetical protein
MESDPKEQLPKNLDDLLSRASRADVPPLLSNTEANVLRTIRMEQARRAEGESPRFSLDGAWWDLTHQKGLVGYGLVLSAIVSLAMAQSRETSPVEEAVPGLRGATFLLSDLDPWERLLRTSHGPQIVD